MNEKHVKIADKINDCKKLVLQLDRPDRIATIQMLIKDARRKLKTDNTIEAALHLCQQEKNNSNFHLWILGTAGIMIDKNL